MADWLDTVFYGFDKAILGFWNSVAEGAGGFFTPIMRIVSLFGDKGIFMILLSIVLMLFKKTRKHGLSALIAIIIGALFTNLILKNVVARARPYTRGEFKTWWELVGAKTESDYSFPSGHATIATDCLFAIFLVSKKKSVSWLLIVGTLLICISRNYLMVHYPTDIIAGVIIGVIAAILATILVDFIYKKIQLNEANKFYNFMLNACILDLFKKKKFSVNISESSINTGRKIKENEKDK